MESDGSSRLAKGSRPSLIALKSKFAVRRISNVASSDIFFFLIIFVNFLTEDPLP